MILPDLGNTKPNPPLVVGHNVVCQQSIIIEFGESTLVGERILGSSSTVRIFPILQEGHLQGSKPVSLTIRSGLVSMGLVMSGLSLSGCTSFLYRLPNMP